MKSKNKDKLTKKDYAKIEGFKEKLAPIFENEAVHDRNIEYCNKLRARCNKLTKSERKKYHKKGMKLINGDLGPIERFDNR